MKMQILDPNYFVSEETGEVADIETATTKAQISIPPQLPADVLEEDVRDTAKAGTTGAVVIIIIQIIAQVFLKSSTNELTSLFFILQFVSIITIYPVNFPSNSLIFLQEIRNLVEFEMLNPQNILVMINPELTIEKILGLAGNKVLNKNLENSGISTGSLIDQMSSYLFMLALYIAAFIVITTAVFLCCRKYK